MTGEEILKRMNDLLNAHLMLDCSIHQAGYKDQYFRLFKEAYRNGDFEPSANPRLTGDAIGDRFFETEWIGRIDWDDPKSKLPSEPSEIVALREKAREIANRKSMLATKENADIYNRAKWQLLRDLLRMWDEWLYALTEVGYVIDPE
jgi:hypothetical protein